MLLDQEADEPTLTKAQLIVMLKLGTTVGDTLRVTLALDKERNEVDLADKDLRSRKRIVRLPR
jgi:hypothetical protein